MGLGTCSACGALLVPYDTVSHIAKRASRPGGVSMKRLFLAAAVAGLWLAACSREPTAPNAPITAVPATPEMLRFESDHPQTHVMLPKGFVRAAAHRSSTGINYHGGPLFIDQTRI